MFIVKKAQYKSGTLPSNVNETVYNAPTDTYSSQSLQSAPPTGPQQKDNERPLQ